MTFKFFLPIFGLVLLTTGCGTLGIVDNQLHLKVTPYPPIRGEKALFVLNAPLNAEKVWGTLEIFTDPTFQFKKNLKRKYWYISNTIPKSALVPAGHYKVRLSYNLRHEIPHYSEVKLELK